MITQLNIENYKSIQKLELSPGRVNLFIGKPVAGKSNIIEAIAMLSRRNVPIRELVRISDYNDLFYDRDLERKIQVETETIKMDLEYKNGDYKISYNSNSNTRSREEWNYNLSAEMDIGTEQTKFRFGPLFYYKFKLLKAFTGRSTERLNSPFGDNLPQILLTRGSLKKIVSDILSEFDLKLSLNPTENSVKVIKEVDNVVYEYPFVTISDSLQRLLFFITAMHTKDSTLLLEEPEAQIFPFYNKYLGEKIALDESNQYFIATHSSAFLFSILQKISPEQLKIYITYYADNQTKIHSIQSNQFSKILDMGEDFFLNLENFRTNA